MALSDADKRTAQFILACRENYSRDQGYNQAAEAVLYLLDCLASAEQELTAARAACGEAAEEFQKQLDAADRGCKPGAHAGGFFAVRLLTKRLRNIAELRGKEKKGERK